MRPMRAVTRFESFSVWIFMCNDDSDTHEFCLISNGVDRAGFELDYLDRFWTCDFAMAGDNFEFLISI